MQITGNIAKLVKANSCDMLLVVPQGTTKDIVRTVLAMDKRSTEATALLAPLLQGNSLVDTCRNIYEFLRQHVRYVEDPRGEQWVQNPSCLILRGTGDCKSYSIFCASVLKNLGIPHLYRFTAPTPVADYSHVYIIVPSASGSYITLDGTLPRFNREAKAAKHGDFKAAMPKASVGNAGLKLRRFNPLTLNQQQASNVAQQLVLQGQPDVSARFTKDWLKHHSLLQVEWTGQTKPSIGYAVSGRFGDLFKNFFKKSLITNIKELVMVKKIQDNLEKAAPFFLYMFTPEAAYQDDWYRFPAAMAKLKNALELYVDVARATKSDVGISLSSVAGAEWYDASMAYSSGDLKTFYNIYATRCFPKVKAAGSNTSFGNLLDIIRRVVDKELGSPVKILNQWMYTGLVEEWQSWTTLPVQGKIVGRAIRAFTPAEAEAYKIRMGATNKGKKLQATGFMQLELAAPNPNITIEAIAGKLKVGEKIYLALDQTFWPTATSYKLQLYAAGYPIKEILPGTRPGTIRVTIAYMVDTLSTTQTAIGQWIGAWSLNNPEVNRSTSISFQYFAYQPKYPPTKAPVAVPGVSEVITIVVTAVVAITTAVASIVALIKDLKGNSGVQADLVPSPYDLSRCYEITGGTACPQPDGSTIIFDRNGNPAEVLPAGTPPPPQALSGNNTILWLGLAAGAALLLFR